MGLGLCGDRNSRRDTLGRWCWGGIYITRITRSFKSLKRGCGATFSCKTDEVRLGLGWHAQRFGKEGSHLFGRTAATGFDASDSILGAPDPLCQVKLGKVESLAACFQPLTK
jgi:hypothetical protein